MTGTSSASFTVACVQNCAADDIDRNLAVADDLTRAAVAAGAELVCLPEFFCQIAPTDASYYDSGFDEADHPALAWGRDTAASLQRWLLLGSIPVRCKKGKVHNRAYLLDPAGHTVATYNKIHLFDVAIRDGQQYRESDSVAAGDHAVVASLPWGGLGLSICYDVRFAALYRQLARAGADFLAIPAAFTAKTGAAHWHTLVRARAIETGCFVFAPGQCGARPWGRRTYGHSLIVDPWGEVLADGGEEEGFVTATVDVSRVAAVRNMIPALKHDREIAGP